jgi:hypothetical protein
MSNRQLMKSIYPDFSAWIAEENSLFSDFCIITDFLQTFLRDFALYDKISCQSVARELSNVLDKCDCLEFNTCEAYAYIIMHFLERYRRFQQIYLLMLKGGFLPMRQKPAHILDVGTGPAMALYSLSDIIELLKVFGDKNQAELLRNIDVRFDYVEKSDGFRDFMHIFTEFSSNNKKYSVPFHRGTFREFRGLNLQYEKHILQQKRIDEEIRDYDDAGEPISRVFAQWLVDQEHGGWKDAYRYNMIVFSNFLTSPSQVDDYRNELESCFRALRNGGTMVFVGASGGIYSEIYSRLKDAMDAIGKGKFQLVLEYSEMSHGLDDPFSQRIRQFYVEITKLFDVFGAKNDIPEKARKHITDIIENTEGKGKIKWSLYIFMKQLKKHY